MIFIHNHKPSIHPFTSKSFHYYLIEEVFHEQVFFFGTVTAFSDPGVRT